MSSNNTNLMQQVNLLARNKEAVKKLNARRVSRVL
jgi:hypothetical protein